MRINKGRKTNGKRRKEKGTNMKVAERRRNTDDIKRNVGDMRASPLAKTQVRKTKKIPLRMEKKKKMQMK